MKKHITLALALTGLILFALPSARAAGEEKAIRDLLNRWEKAFRSRNAEAVMSFYAPGNQLVAFDIAPPLACVGQDAYRKNYEDFFAAYEGPLEVEMRDLRITVGGEVAFLTCLERISGVLKGGQKSALWCRVTSGLRKVGGQWVIVHDHVSVPVDFESGKALLELKP
jgi:uncharacterized protein (TIGR02246 family)